MSASEGAPTKPLLSRPTVGDSSDEETTARNRRDAKNVQELYAPENREESTRPLFWIILALLGAIVLSFVVLSIVTTCFQFAELERQNTAGLDNIVTRRTLAFAHSGPLTPLCMFSVGAVAIFVAISALNRRKVQLKVTEIVIFSVMFAISIAAQIWLTAKIDSFKRESYRVQSTPDDYLGAENEQDLKYLNAWFTSPLATYVFGTNVYYCAALFALVALLVALYFVVRQSHRKEKRAFLSSKNRTQTVGNVLVVIAIVLLVLTCLSHLALAFLAVFNHIIVSSHHYWAIFVDAAISYNFYFFFAGWLFFSWWFGVFAAPSRLLKTVTVIVGLATLFLLVTQLWQWGTDFGILDSCRDKIFAGEGYPDAEVEFCELQYEEQRDNKGVWLWYVINTFAFFGVSAFAIIATVISMIDCCDGDGGSGYMKGKERLSGDEQPVFKSTRAARARASKAEIKGAYFADFDDD